MTKERRIILNRFSEWIAFSSTRSGSPLKARKDVYPLIKTPDYKAILEGDKRIEIDEFSAWHKSSTKKITDKRSEMPVGWATKLINVYLKSMVYSAGVGRKGLARLIHPPIDNGLWQGIKKEFSSQKAIIDLTHHQSRIKNIKTYKDYQRIIKGMRMIADKKGIDLIEVEQYWLGTIF